MGLTFFSAFAKDAAICEATKKFVLNSSMDSDDMAIIQNVVGNSFITVLGLLRNLGHIKKAILSLKFIYSTLETESLIPPYAKENINKLSPDSIKGKIE